VHENERRPVKLMRRDVDVFKPMPADVNKPDGMME